MHYLWLNSYYSVHDIFSRPSFWIVLAHQDVVPLTWNHKAEQYLEIRGNNRIQTLDLIPLDHWALQCLGSAQQMRLRLHRPWRRGTTWAQVVCSSGDSHCPDQPFYSCGDPVTMNWTVVQDFAYGWLIHLLCLTSANFWFYGEHF